MVVAVSFAWAVEVTVDEIVDVIAVRYSVVTAIGTMFVTGFVAFAFMVRSAFGWIAR